MSIKNTLQKSIILLVIIPTILITVLTYTITINKYIESIKNSVAQKAYAYSATFSSRLKSQMNATRSLSENEDIIRYLSESRNTFNSPSASVEPGNIRNLLEQMESGYNIDLSYYLYDEDGNLIASSTSSPVPDWTDVMAEDVTSFTDMKILDHSPFKEDTFDILAPIIVQQQAIGLIRTNIGADSVGIYDSNTEKHFMVDDSGTFLLGYQSEDKYDDSFSEHIKNQIQNEIFTSSAYDAFIGHGGYTYGYSSISGFDWIYVIKQSPMDYFHTMIFLPVLILITLIGVIILSVQISHKLAYKYTEPILILSSKMQYAANGRLDIHYETDRKDEFGMLASNFNRMMDIISANYNEIMKAREELEDKQKALENNYKHIERLAYTDTLTELYNRTAFFKNANEILSKNQDGIKNHAVIFIDLDGFKSINDTRGHDFGDLLLQAIATKLSSLIDNTDVLARNGGDEFVILRNHVESHEELEGFLASLISIASQPIVIEGEPVHITLSAGVALFPQNGLSLSELMKNADIAMYISKSEGKNNYTFFTSNMEDAINRRSDLINILRNAIDKGEIYLLYQPQADAATGEIIGFEALMRVNSPILGLISPEEFIPLAEESGLIDILGEWALIEACRFNQRIIEAGYKPLRASVNVSSCQMQGDHLLEVIKTLPQKTNMPLKYLEIEVTESVLMTNIEHNLDLVNQIKDLEVQISLDDFGTGYSSFSYLTMLPINTLKIDKSFIEGICENENDSYIAETIINLAHKLGITVIAEGVETIDQLRILQTQMCDILQGFFFSKPLFEDEFLELLKINS